MPMFGKRRAKLRAAVVECVLEGVYPSQERECLRAGLTKCFPATPEYRQVWLDAMHEHGLAPRLRR